MAIPIRPVTRSRPKPDTAEFPVLIRLLGSFQVLHHGVAISLRSNGKTEALLCRLALRSSQGVLRDALVEAIWPNVEHDLAVQSLHSLIYALHRQLDGNLGGLAPILHEHGCYRLNLEAGIQVDVANFDALAAAGHDHKRAGRTGAAIASYERAVDFYRGDLYGGSDVQAMIERERLRALHLNMLSQLAEHRFNECNYDACLRHALRLVEHESCREDAHRLVMRCYVRRGERAQALRQYRLCQEILRTEFDAPPEPATVALFDLVRLDPASV